jgi:hypothetical protein
MKDETIKAFDEIRKALGGDSLMISTCGNDDGEAERLLQEECEHEYEWLTQPGTVNGPAEHFHVCKHCGAEDDGD